MDRAHLDPQNNLFISSTSFSSCSTDSSSIAYSRQIGHTSPSTLPPYALFDDLRHQL